MIYLQLFFSFFQIGAFSFGGGFAAMPLIQHQVVDLHGWLTLGEFTDLVTISQMTPGPIAINAATFVGAKVGGMAGSAVATAGCVFPSCILVSMIAWVYFKYRKMELLKGVLKALRPGVVALIAGAGLTVILSTFFGEGAALTAENFHLQEACLFAAAFLILRWKKTDPILVMVLCGAAEILLCTLL